MSFMVLCLRLNLYYIFDIYRDISYVVCIKLCFYFSRWILSCPKPFIEQAISPSLEIPPLIYIKFSYMYWLCFWTLNQVIGLLCLWAPAPVF